MLAGGIAGGLFGVGWGILGVVAIFLIVVVLFGALLLMLFGGADVTGGLGALVIGILVVALVVGAGLVVAAVLVSLRILRRGGLHRPKAVTWLSLLIVLAVNTLAQRLADPYISLGSDTEAPMWVRIVVGVVLLLVAIGSGIGTWMLMAHAFRAPSAPATAAPLPAAPPVG